ncbi:MAG: hypothetical protein ACREFX_09215 [Opitutaceae bacterium]
MKAILPILLGCALGLSTAAAAPLRLNLGDGLLYARVIRLPGDLPADAPRPGHPLVLDLRYVRGDAADAGRLLAWLRARAGVRHPVLMLVNAQTSPALLAPLASADAVPGVVIIGPDTADFAVDIPVSIPPAAELRAYDALAKGADPAKLIDANPPKTRDDEARLEREHLPDEDAGDAPADQAGSKWTPPLVDRALRRAVQLDRTLLALKRI